MWRTAIGRFGLAAFQDRTDVLATLGHKQRQGLERVFGNVEISRTQKSVEPVCDVEHFVMGLGFFPGVKDHVFFAIPYDNIFHNNSHAVLSPINTVYVALVGPNPWRA